MCPVRTSPGPVGTSSLECDSVSGKQRDVARTADFSHGNADIRKSTFERWNDFATVCSIRAGTSRLDPYLNILVLVPVNSQQTPGQAIIPHAPAINRRGKWVQPGSHVPL